MLGSEICGTILELLKPIIPDLVFQTGDAESGVDSLVLQRKKYADIPQTHIFSYLDDILEKFIPDLKGYLIGHCPLTKEETGKVKEVLAQWKNGKLILIKTNKVIPFNKKERRKT